MDSDLVIEPEDDRMELIEDISFDKPLPSKGEKPAPVTVPSIDFVKLKQELDSPALELRLLHMLEFCENLRPEIAEQLHNELVRTNSKNIEIYRKLISLLKSLKVPGAVPVDEKLVEAIETQNSNLIHAELSDVKKHSDDGITENIRLAVMKVFGTYMQAGKYHDAATNLRSFVRDYVCTSQTTMEMTMDLLKATVYQGDFGRIINNVLQAERAIFEVLEKETRGTNRMDVVKYRNLGPGMLLEDPSYRPMPVFVKEALAHAAAIHALGEFNDAAFRDAAFRFLYIDYHVFNLQSLLAMSDVAFCGVLCALATFNRSEIEKHVIANSNFRKFLEHETRLFSLVQYFKQNDFSKFYSLLKEVFPYTVLNVYTAPFANRLIALIRQSALVQYITPFSVISLRTMTEVFHTTLAELIDEILNLIDKGVIKARIDTLQMELHRAPEDKSALRSAKLAELQIQLHRRLMALLTRASLSLNGIVLPSHGEGGGENDVPNPPNQRARRAAMMDREDEDQEDTEMRDEQLGMFGIPGPSSRRNVFQRVRDRFAYQGGRNRPAAGNFPTIPPPPGDSENEPPSSENEFHDS